MSPATQGVGFSSTFSPPTSAGPTSRQELHDEVKVPLILEAVEHLDHPGAVRLHQDVAFSSNMSDLQTEGARRWADPVRSAPPRPALMTPVPAPSPTCQPFEGSSWHKCGPCLSSAPGGPEGVEMFEDCDDSALIHSDKDQALGDFYLSKSSSSDDFKGLKVVQPESGPLQPQELRLLTGVLRAPRYLLQVRQPVRAMPESILGHTKRTVPPHLAALPHPSPSPASSA